MASWLTVGKSFKPVDRQLPTVPETVTTKRDTARTVTETVTTELVQTNYDHSSTTNGDSNVFHSHHNSHVVNSYGNSNSYRDSHRDRDSDRDSVGHSYDRKEARKEKKNKEKKKKDKKHKKKVSKNESIENAIALIDNNSNNNSNSNNSCSYSHNNDHSTIPIDDISASSDDNSVHSDTNRVLGAVNYDTHSVRYLPNKRIVTVPKESEKYRISWEVNRKGDADAFLYDFSYNPPAELVRRQYQLPSGATISSTKNRSSNNTNKTDQIYGNKLVNLAQEKLLRKENMSREQRYYSKTSKDIISNAQLKRIRVVDANNKKESQKSQENNSNSTTTSDLRNDRVVTTNGATAMVIYDYSKSMESDDHELNFIPVRNKESLASFFRSTSSTTTNSNNNDDNFGVVLDADTSLSSYQELQSRVYTEKEILEKKLYQYTKFYNEHNRVYPNKIVLWFKYIFIQNYFNNLQLIISNSNSSMNNYVKSFFEKNKKSNNYQVVIDKKIDLFQKAISIFNSISNISSTNSNSGSNDSSTIDTIVELLWLELLQFVHYYRPDAIQGFIRQSLVQLPLSTRLHYFNCSFSLRHPNSNDINNVRLKTMQTYDAIKESVANIYAAENMNKLLSNSKSNRVYRNSGEANDLTLLKSKEELEAIWCDCYYRRILAEKEAGNTELSVALVQVKQIVFLQRISFSLIVCSIFSVSQVISSTFLWCVQIGYSGDKSSCKRQDRQFVRCVHLQRLLGS